jgi:hypothetical protein
MLSLQKLNNLGTSIKNQFRSSTNQEPQLGIISRIEQFGKHHQELFQEFKKSRTSIRNYFKVKPFKKFPKEY